MNSTIIEDNLISKSELDDYKKYTSIILEQLTVDMNLKVLEDKNEHDTVKDSA